MSVADFEHEAWGRARPAHIARYWSGEAAPEGRHAEARVVWTDAALVVKFDCRQEEPLVVSTAPNLREKTLGLWDRDVCEIFLAPDAAAPERYFEFEAAPTGEWIDLAIHWRPQGRETDWPTAKHCNGGAHRRHRERNIRSFKSPPPLARGALRANLFPASGPTLYRYIACNRSPPKPNSTSRELRARLK